MVSIILLQNIVVVKSTSTSLILFLLQLFISRQSRSHEHEKITRIPPRELSRLPCTFFYIIPHIQQVGNVEQHALSDLSSAKTILCKIWLPNPSIKQIISKRQLIARCTRVFGIVERGNCTRLPNHIFVRKTSAFSGMYVFHGFLGSSRRLEME